MIDLGSRQSTETKLIDTLEDIQESLKATYQRKIHERVSGGVSGAGAFGSSFLGTLGFGQLAAAVKKSAEAKEIDRQEKEKFVQNFQENDSASEILTKSTTRAVAESMYEAKKQEQVTSSEDEIEANTTRTKQLEIQTKTSEDITDLFVISDDYFKAQMKHNEEMKKLFEQIRDSGGMGGGSLLGSLADLAGGAGGRGKAGTAGKVGKLAGMAGKLGTVAKVGGGLFAVGTAAYDAYGDYSEADRQVNAGEITKEEGQVKKGEAVGGGVGAAGGALAGAKAGAMLGAFGGPIGMAVGGLLGGAAGYFGGKWLGKKAGGTAVSGYQAVTETGSPVASNVTPETVPASTPMTVTPAPTPTLTPKSAPTAAPAPAPLVEKAQPQAQTSASGETYDNRSAITGFTKEFLEGVASGSISGPISADQARDYLNKIQPGEIGYKKKFMRGRPVGATPTEPPTPLPAETMPPEQAGEIQIRRRGVLDAEAAAAMPATNNTVVAPSTTNVINNTTTTESKGSKNSEPTFQRFMDRRYYPAASM